MTEHLHNEFKSLKEKCVALEIENTCLREQIDKLDRENTDIQESYMKLYNDSKDENRKLKEEIQILKEESKIHELQDLYQQNCIRFNDMRTAYLVATDELAKLRKQFGVGQ